MFDTNFFSSFSKSIEQLKAQNETMRAAIAAKEAEIQSLKTSPPPKSDIKSAVIRVMESRAAQFDAAMLQTFSLFGSHIHNIDNNLGALRAMSLLGAARRDIPSNGSESLEIALLALLGPQLKAAAIKLIDEMSWPDAGPPLDKRPALIEKATRELEELRREHTELRRQATAAGLMI